MASPVVIPDIDDQSIDIPRQSSSQPAPSSYSALTRECRISGELESLILVRENEGRCATCGLQTHVLRTDPETHEKVKLPLTIWREVHRGRCLLCHPLLDYRVHHTIQNVANCLAQGLEANTVNPFHTIDPCSITDELPLGFTSSFNFGGLGRGDSRSPPELVDILHAMINYPYDTAIQEKCCEELWIQSWDDETSYVIGQIGGIDAILDAMVHFPDNLHVQRCACEAIQNLASSSRNRNAIVGRGGAGLIVQTMMLHLHSLSMQLCGSRAILALAASPELCPHILQAGGGLALVHSMGKYEANKGFCVEASATLQALGLVTETVRLWPKHS